LAFRINKISNFPIKSAKKINFSWEKKKKDDYYNCVLFREEDLVHLLENSDTKNKFNGSSNIKSVSNDSQILIFTDGGSVNNGNKDPDSDMYGSYGISAVWKEQRVTSLSDILENATNNQSEMTGIIKSLEYFHDKLDEYPQINIFSDSQYCIMGITEWRYKWQKSKAWNNDSNDDVKNKLLWKKLISLVDYNEKTIRFGWVRGHNTNNNVFTNMNNYVDQLAQDELEHLR
jgi:ribonuclease HI